MTFCAREGVGVGDGGKNTSEGEVEQNMAKKTEATVDCLEDSFLQLPDFQSSSCPVLLLRCDRKRCVSMMIGFGLLKVFLIFLFF